MKNKPLRIKLEPVYHIDQRVTIPHVELSQAAHEIRLELADGYGLPRHLFLSREQAQSIADWINADPSAPLNSPLNQQPKESGKQ